MSENGFVKGVDAAWMKLGEMFRLPSAVSPSQAGVSVYADTSSPTSTIIDLPRGRSVAVKLLELKGEYDFNTQSSQYKSTFGVGDAKLKLKHDVLSNNGQFELEGPMWEVGYKHAGKLAHAKKKLRITKNLLFIARQDFPNMDVKVVPSPELQLEHEIKNKYGLKKHKLELKYHVGNSIKTIEEEAVFGPYYKFKSSIDSYSKAAGAKLSLEMEPRKRLFDELKIKYTKKAPVLLEFKVKPVRGLKLKTVVDAKTRVVTGEVELQAERDGMKVELQNFVSRHGWAKPRLQVGFKW